jgi:6-phosphogluconolactonase
MKKRLPAHLEIFDHPDEVFERAAQIFARASQSAIEHRGRFVVALTGGRTAGRFYPMLSATESGIDWPDVEFLFGDERCVPPDDPDSNYRLARQTLLEPLNIRADRIHRIEAERADPELAARNYQESIAGLFRIDPEGPPPAIDLMLFSLGADGHLASLFPGTSALEEEQRWVVFSQVPGLDAPRMTLTFPMINQARRVLFLVTGHSKAHALYSVLQGERHPSRLPAQSVNPHHGDLHWLADAAAASRLES